MAYLSLAPVSAGIYTKLNVSGLTSLVSKVASEIPQGQALPYVWYEVRERDVRGFGTGGLPEVELRVHSFGDARLGVKPLQIINQKVIELLRDQAVTVSGYDQAGLIFYDEMILLTGEEINGVKVNELVSRFRLYVEE